MEALSRAFHPKLADHVLMPKYQQDMHQLDMHCSCWHVDLEHNYAMSSTAWLGWSELACIWGRLTKQISALVHVRFHESHFPVHVILGKGAGGSPAACEADLREVATVSLGVNTPATFWPKATMQAPVNVAMSTTSVMSCCCAYSSASPSVSRPSASVLVICSRPSAMLIACVTQ